MVCEHVPDQMPSRVTIQSMNYSLTGIEKRKGNSWEWMSACVTIARNCLQHAELTVLDALPHQKSSPATSGQFV